MEVAAFITDLGFSFCLFFGALRISGVSPVPHWTWLLWIPMLFVSAGFVQKRFTRRTLGERAWSLRMLPTDQEGRHWKLFQAEKCTLLQCLRGILLTLSGWGLALFILQSTYAGNPRWLGSELWKIQPFMPAAGSSEGGISWQVLPYYYSLGAWPKTFAEQPVFHAVPYKKGPPQVFLEGITANWRSPGIRMTFEGPKTPDGHRTDPKDQSTLAVRVRLRRCLGPTWTSPLLDWGCMGLRDEVLSRHLQEMEKLQPELWTLRWFVVENPSLPAAEQAQGFYLRAENSTRFQSRFVVITANGTHQAFILHGTKDAEGAQAEQTLQRAIGSLRVSNDLNPGRAWIDRQLQGIDLGKILAGNASEATIRNLAEIQALLLSKLTVDPGSFDSYYHLGGTALLLLKLAAAMKQSDWSITAKPMVFSAYRYAQDVAPNDPRLPKLQNIWLDSKKY
ncbi:MAG TPA: hypothetical protein DCS07_11550 [Bdellovibrionales bacterium]|nr:MAG: hypothetical protein A2X97_08320 [Bdellovibrionales bacterium GWA1_52_35]OFZ38147.1 MAG: hypothetical protein A2070_09215 [Bdellovibrionales bacterium GWC1_52_8]HAR43243.1 hypothetical protein [Bdellovibrionales bacterium]HCM41507.1 hypothetical protein [Bdellovibrionales bacterium]